MIKVSIVTIVYNAEKTLEQTILSVLNQTYKNIEYIIIDGGSKDKSVEIIKRYQSRIAKWISEPDKGISDAFNKGIALATGDIIGILNADDWYVDDAVESVIKNLSDDYDVYCGNLMLVEGSDVMKERKSRISWLNFGMYIMHPTVFVKSKVYKSVGWFDTSLKIAMDFDMMLRFKKRYVKFRYINKLMAYMRTDGVSGDVKKMHKEELLVMQKHLSRFALIFSGLFNYANRLIRKFYYKNSLKTDEKFALGGS